MASASVRSTLYQDFLNKMFRKVAQRQFDSHLVRDFERRSDDRHRLHLVLESIEAALNTEVNVETTTADGHISAVTCGRHERECRHAEERIRVVIGSEDGERKVRVEAVRELSRHARSRGNDWQPEHLAQSWHPDCTARRRSPTAHPSVRCSCGMRP